MKSLWHRNWPAGVALIFGVVVTAWQWYAINPDGIAYTDIAQKWAAGRWHEAVNAYWSPFWSWLLVPGFCLGFKPWVIIRILQFLLFILALRDWQKWLLWLRGRKEIPWLPWLELAGGINLAYFAQAISGPDLLASLLVLHFLRIAITGTSTIYTGVLLGIMFLTKVYLLFFAILALGVIAIYQLIYGRLWLDQVRKMAVIFLVSAVFIAPWVGLMHQKYGTWGLGSSGKYNALNRFPGGIEHPWKNAGLLPPPDDYSTFVWTDITQTYARYQYLKQYQQSPVSSVLVYNVKKTLRLLVVNCAFLIAGLYFAFYKKRNGRLPWDRIILLSVLGALYLAGYELFSAEHRYFWPVFMIGISLPVLWHSRFPTRYLIVGWVCLLLTLPHSAIRSFIPQNGVEEYREAKLLKTTVPVGARIASWSTRQTWFVSFFNRYKDFGGVEGEDPDKCREKLRQHGISYLLFQKRELSMVKSRLGDLPVRNVGSWYFIKLE